MVIIWFLLDCVLLGCAYVFLHIIELERIAWSKLAQVGINYKAKLDGELAEHVAGIKPADLISEKWRILVYSYDGRQKLHHTFRRGSRSK